MKAKYMLMLIVLSLFLVSCSASTDEDSEKDKKTPVLIWKTIDSGYEHIDYKENK